MIEILLMGFLLGMRHAIESDHVAAVTSLLTRSVSLKESIRLGSIWGLGHTITLFLLGTLVMMMDHMIPEHIEMILEFAVGFMLVLLGIDVLRRHVKEHIHMHLHHHENGTIHLHAHTHGRESENHQQTQHANDEHAHMHPDRFPLRALLVGIMHGMAGSAALIVLTLQSVHSFSTGLIYIALFGIGSIAGMAALSVAIILPLRQSRKQLNWLHQYLLLGIGSMTVLLGCSMMIEISRNHLFI